MRKKTILGVLVVGAAAVAAGAWLGAGPDLLQAPSAKDRAAAKAQSPAHGAVPEGALAALPRRETIGRPRGDLFGSRSWAPPPNPAAAPVMVETPAPPPMPYRVAGKLVRDGGAQVVLAKGDRVLTVREGDELEGGYRVESIRPDQVTLVYLPLGLQQTLAVASNLGVEPPQAVRAAEAPNPQATAASGDRPAQLRWEGPAQVRAGASFDVALKVTSGQAVVASPMQLTFDAAVLEPVAVRAGGFYAGGSFSYRVNPAGSIFVGASGKGAVPADAEMLVVTFRPTRAGATAELKVSSLLLQGAAGRAVLHDQPAAFRTAIVQ